MSDEASCMHGGSASLSPNEALRALGLHARLERMRGVRYWWDAELGAGLRELVRTVGTGSQARGIASPGRAGSKDGRSIGNHSTLGTPVNESTGSLRAARSHSADVVPERSGLQTPHAAGKSAGGSTASPPSEARQSPHWPMPPIAAGRDPDWRERLDRVAARAHSCVACELCKTRTKVAFGAGTAAVPLVFVGEAPGADEDRQGIPFVGKAGQLLTRIIGAIGLDREEVYICNVLKCRPPGNRNPAPDEIARCTPFLREQMEILKPKVICTLGLFASQFLLDTKVPIGRLRGRVSEYHGIPVIPTYHPAALLRDPSLKAAVWEDVQLVRRTLDA